MNSEEVRTVVITGGTGGIGFQSALGIATTGAHVVITGRNRDRGDEAVQRIIDETGNDRVELVVGDVSSIEGIDALARALVDRLDHIDVLVNNAGYMGSAPASSDDGVGSSTSPAGTSRRPSTRTTSRSRRGSAA